MLRKLEEKGKILKKLKIQLFLDVYITNLDDHKKRLLSEYEIQKQQIDSLRSEVERFTNDNDVNIKNNQVLDQTIKELKQQRDIYRFFIKKET